jgi:hypothetical protein
MIETINTVLNIVLSTILLIAVLVVAVAMFEPKK